MARYGVATIMTDDWGEALVAAMVEMWRHRVIAHGDRPALNLELAARAAEGIRPPAELVCPHCAFRIVAFEYTVHPSPEPEEEEITDAEADQTWFDILWNDIDSSQSP